MMKVGVDESQKELDGSMIPCGFYYNFWWESYTGHGRDWMLLLRKKLLSNCSGIWRLFVNRLWLSLFLEEKSTHCRTFEMDLCSESGIKDWLRCTDVLWDCCFRRSWGCALERKKYVACSTLKMILVFVDLGVLMTGTLMEKSRAYEFCKLK